MASDPSFVANRLSFSVNVIGFGADPTGVEDSGPAFAAAIAVCRERNYSTLHVPAGVYKISSFGGGGSGTDPCEENLVGWCLNRLSGLRILGDGALRSPSQNEPPNDDFVGTIIRFDLPPDGTDRRVGIGIKACTAVVFEDLTIQGALTNASVLQVIGIRIESIGGFLGTTAIQFRNCSFMWCDVAVQTANNNNNNNSELAFYDCSFIRNRIGFQSLHSQALVQEFIGCVGGGSAGPDTDQYQGMETMFDLTAGGNITVIGFGGQNIKTFVKVGQGGGNIGWNLIHNIRLEQMGDGDENTWGNENRTRLYEAVGSSGATSGQRTEFNGVVLIPPGAGTPQDDGTPRFSLLDGHMVVLRNASRAASADYQLATVTSKLVEFKTTGGTRGGTFRAFNVQVPFDARLNRDDVPAIARYSFNECNDDNVPYPDLLHPPLYGPNYLMSVESHCWVAGDGQTGVNAATAGGGLVAPVAPSDVLRAGVLACDTSGPGDVASLVSAVDAVRFGGGTWRFQASVRIHALSDSSNSFAVRIGFGDDGEGEPDNGLYFSYKHASNSGKWECIHMNGGDPSDTDPTDIAADTGWHTFEIEVVPGSPGTATFYIDGVEVGQVGVPAAAVGLLPVQVERFTLTGSEEPRAAKIDYFKYTFRPSETGTMYPE